MPLTAEAVAERLAPPNEEDLRVRAETLKHPILRPVLLDLRDGLSPDEAAILAVIVNPRLRAIRDRKAVSAAQLFQAGILPNPQLAASFETPVGAGASGSVNAFGVGLDWDVGSLIARASGVDAARAHAAAVDLEVAWQEWQVAEAAKRRAHRLALADEALALAKSSAALREHALALVQQGVSMGENTALDLATAGAACEAARVAAQVAEGDKESERLALNQALGLPAGYAIRVQDDAGVLARQPVPSAAEATAEIETRRLDLAALRMGYESQEAEVRAAIRSQVPRIGIGLDAARDTDALTTVGFGVSIDLPFFDRSQGRIAVERATRQQLFDEYVARLFEARADVARIVAELRATRDQLRTVDDSLPVLESLAGSYEEAFQDGATDALTYYELLESLYARQREALQLRGKLVELGVALELATGKYFPEAGAARSAPPHGKRTSERGASQ